MSNTHHSSSNSLNGRIDSHRREFVKIKLQIVEKATYQLHLHMVLLSALLRIKGIVYREVNQATPLTQPSCAPKTPLKKA
jgi:hypothetical protein